MLPIPKACQMIPTSYRLFLLVIILLGGLTLSLGWIQPVQAKRMAENSPNNETNSPRAET